MIPEARSLDWARAGIKTAHLNDSSILPNTCILFSIFQFLMGTVMDINKLYQYIATFNFINFTIKKLIEKSRECHNHQPQPTTDTKRKRKGTKSNTYKTNKHMHEKHTDQLPLPQAR